MICCKHIYKAVGGRFRSPEQTGAFTPVRKLYAYPITHVLPWCPLEVAFTVARMKTPSTPTPDPACASACALSCLTILVSKLVSAQALDTLTSSLHRSAVRTLFLTINPTPMPPRTRPAQKPMHGDGGTRKILQRLRVVYNEYRPSTFVLHACGITLKKSTELSVEATINSRSVTACRIVANEFENLYGISSP